MNASEPVIVAYIEYTTGERRSVFEDPNGGQYIVRDDGERVYGLWYILRELESDPPAVVSDDPF